MVAAVLHRSGCVGSADSHEKQTPVRFIPHTSISPALPGLPVLIPVLALSGTTLLRSAS
jgi:hypothetical protein